MLSQISVTRYLLSYLPKWLLPVFFIYPSLVLAQPCTTTQFSKGYGFEGFGAGFFFDKNPKGQFYFGGVKNYNMVLSTADDDGNLIWSKQYEHDQATVYSNYGLAAIDSNGSYFVNVDGKCIGMLDANGAPLMAREMAIPYDNVFGTCMGVLADNKKIILVNDQSTYGAEGYMLMCLSADLSTIIWNKHFSGSDTYFSEFTIVGNKVFVTGSFQNSGTLLCFDAANGNLISKRFYNIDNKRTHLEKLHAYKNGYIMYARYYGGEINNHLIIRLDQNLNVLNSYRLPNIWDNASLALAVEADGSFYGAWSAGGFGHYRFYMSRQDSVLWNRSNLTAGLTYPRILRNTNEGLILFSGGNWFNVGVNTYGSALVLSRSDENGYFLNCYPYDQPFQKAAITYTTGISSLIPRDTSMITLLSASISASDNSTVVNQNCSSTSVCDTLSIQGNKTFCNNGAATFIARRNPGCYTPVRWTINGSMADFQKLNDSTLSVQFLQSGAYELIAELGTCQRISDTITVNVTVASQYLELGSDTTLCPGNTIVLNAHKGYTSYLWQDGSTDSAYEVKQAGLYHVIVTDACGTVQRDTVSVIPHPIIPFDIGLNRTKCNNDTIHINAPTGFLNYAWSPSYNINSLTAQNVIVNPVTDTFYTIRAEKTPGCFAYDTIHITVYQSPPINLGADTSFCSGDNVIYNAGNNFSTYRWSTGETSPAITVQSPGIYSIHAIATNGCNSYDTVKVISVFSNPGVTLNHDNTLCTGSSRVLDAGSFLNYLWSNGTSDRTITVNKTGIYSVMVTDNNGCKGYDTTTINSLLVIPAGFLPVDTSVCSYGSIQINPLHNFQSYQWSNNVISKSVTITQPGTYWLQVTDANNCTGKDTIVVSQQECMSGFYMPDAFTPNRDGKNDLLRPLLFGNVKQYMFTVYNRWGQIVFQTKDISKAWDGNSAGIPQDSNVFIWNCSYQFEGEKINSAKGTVVLIR